MRNTLIITLCVIFFVCLGHLHAGRCWKNTRSKPNRCKSSAVCCENPAVYYCVKQYSTKKNGVRVTGWKICKKKRGSRKCKCMAGCKVVEYGSEKEHFIPVRGEEVVGCRRYGCRAIYSYYDFSINRCEYYEKGQVGSCFRLFGGK